MNTSAPHVFVDPQHGLLFGEEAERAELKRTAEREREQLQSRCDRLEIENARLRADLDQLLSNLLASSGGTR